jgi:hypothetical protein
MQRVVVEEDESPRSGEAGEGHRVGDA